MNIKLIDVLAVSFAALSTVTIYAARAAARKAKTISELRLGLGYADLAGERYEERINKLKDDVEHLKHINNELIEDNEDVWVRYGSLLSSLADMAEGWDSMNSTVYKKAARDLNALIINHGLHKGDYDAQEG